VFPKGEWIDGLGSSLALRQVGAVAPAAGNFEDAGEGRNAPVTQLSAQAGKGGVLRSGGKLLGFVSLNPNYAISEAQSV
jgi:hypothetical protein